MNLLNQDKYIGQSSRIKLLEIGSKYGDNTVLEQTLSKKGKTAYKCQCDCGKIRIIKATSLRTGRAKRCRSCASTISKMTHGKSYHYLYGIWSGIKIRCYNSNRKGFHRYGGRGIKMFHEWINKPAVFIDYVESTIGARPGNPPDYKNTRPYYQLDRINNNGNYEPGNLHWATVKENNNNTQRAKNKRAGKKQTIISLEEYEFLKKFREQKKKTNYIVPDGQLLIT